MIALEANWNRPLLVVAMICFTIITCYLIVHGHKWIK